MRTSDGVRRVNRVAAEELRDDAGRIARTRFPGQRVDDAEHGRVRADTERQHGHRHDGEAAMAIEEPEPEAQVLEPKSFGIASSICRPTIGRKCCV